MKDFLEFNENEVENEAMRERMAREAKKIHAELSAEKIARAYLVLLLEDYTGFPSCATVKFMGRDIKGNSSENL